MVQLERHRECSLACVGAIHLEFYNVFSASLRQLLFVPTDRRPQDLLRSQAQQQQHPIFRAPMQVQGQFVDHSQLIVWKYRIRPKFLFFLSGSLHIEYPVCFVGKMDADLKHILHNRLCRFSIADFNCWLPLR